jgi:hypothetical protein
MESNETTDGDLESPLEAEGFDVLEKQLGGVAISQPGEYSFHVEVSYFGRETRLIAELDGPQFKCHPA